MRVAQLLGAWLEVEVDRAYRSWVCRGLAYEHVEDFYQDTVLALWNREFEGEEHLRNALRYGIKCRALSAHRDRRRHTRIWERILCEMRPFVQADQGEQAPEPLVLAKENRWIVAEFMAELSEDEQGVYWLMSVEHRGHIYIAQTLDIPANQARNTMRACERRRERFQTLFDGGRLCGHRAKTIQVLNDGEMTGTRLMRQALVHIQNCPECHKAHGKLAERLCRAFQN